MTIDLVAPQQAKPGPLARERSNGIETMKLTDQQSLRIAELPEDYRVIGLDGSGPMVRKPSGQDMRIQQNGRLTVATIAAKRRLADRRSCEAARIIGGVQTATRYTSVLG
jgi:hypothetical protein